MGTGVQPWWVGGRELGTPQPWPGLAWPGWLCKETFLLSEPWSRPWGHLVFPPCSPDRASVPPPLT